MAADIIGHSVEGLSTYTNSTSNTTAMPATLLDSPRTISTIPHTAVLVRETSLLPDGFPGAYALKPSPSSNSITNAIHSSTTNSVHAETELPAIKSAAVVAVDTEFKRPLNNSTAQSISQMQVHDSTLQQKSYNLLTTVIPEETSSTAASTECIATNTAAVVSPVAYSIRMQTLRDRARSPTASEIELRKSRDLVETSRSVSSTLPLAAALSPGTQSSTTNINAISGPYHIPNIRRNTVSDAFNISKSAVSVAVPIDVPLLPTSEPASRMSPTRKFTSQDLMTGRRSMHGREVLVGTPVKEGHANYMLMYDMLTGIRISVSRCNAKPLRDIVAEDFTAAHKLAFDVTGNEMTPSSKYDFKFKDYAPWVFRRVRDSFHVDPAEYLLSLTGKYVLSELGSPGKSGSFFYYSQDYRFIIKTIHHSEHKFILKILEYYYNHIRSNPHTLLSRIFGLHRVKLPGNRKIHFVVMGNVFPPNKDIHEVYDLKGSIVGRSISEEEACKNPRAVMKDLNWLDRSRKMLLGTEKRRLLIEQIERDCAFLVVQKIMDYSLLVGLHDVVKGNRDNIRDLTLSVFEPNPETLSRRATAANRMSKAQVIRKAMVESDIMQLGPSSSKLPDNAPPERRYCIFYQDEGGFRATDETNMPLKEIYYIGIIDIFTKYSATKKVEHFFKSFGNDSTKISAVNPMLYGKRFIEFMRNAIKGYTGDPSDANQISSTPASPGFPPVMGTLNSSGNMPAMSLVGSTTASIP
ncbi:hypothetical protein BDV3_000763 [Batrachochytrium dendrobatidis]